MDSFYALRSVNKWYRILEIPCISLKIFFLGTAELCTVEAQLIYDERALSAFVLTPPGEGESERERQPTKGLNIEF